jgi:hypothetical protein
LTNPASASESELTIADDLRRQGKAVIQYLQMHFHSLGIRGANCQLMHKERSHEEAGSSLPNRLGIINSFIELT